ncbi:MAG: dTMP kinase, partial [Deltaproteobacteria bacterium]|nr:dTMP kinase [Deltaproteobacteria bacterium]
MASLFITFEGIEGSGKSTQLKLLHEVLIGQGRKVLVTREPGGTVIAEAIRKVLLSPDHKDMSPMTELMLYAAARAEHVGKVIRPALAEGHTVLC